MKLRKWNTYKGHLKSKTVILKISNLMSNFFGDENNCLEKCSHLVYYVNLIKNQSIIEIFNS